MGELDNTIVLNDGSGNKIEFEFLDLVKYMDEEYIVLLPCDEAEKTEGSQDVVILKVDDDGNQEFEEYSNVDDEAVLNAVFEIFKEKL